MQTTITVEWKRVADGIPEQVLDYAVILALDTDGNFWSLTHVSKFAEIDEHGVTLEWYAVIPWPAKPEAANGKD